MAAARCQHSSQQVCTHPAHFPMLPVTLIPPCILMFSKGLFYNGCGPASSTLPCCAALPLLFLLLHVRSTNKCVIASAGCQVDMKALQKLLQARNVMFQHNHGKPMSCKATAQLLSNTLYYKRFFPYYTFNLCAGLDEEGKPAS